MYNIFNEDCLNGMQKLESGSVDLIVTDPPYCVGMTMNGIKGGFGDFIMLKPFFDSLFTEWQRLLKSGGHIYINTDWRTYPFLYPIMLKYFEVRNLIIWDKDWINAGSWYRFRHELIIFATNGKSQRTFKNTEPDIWKVRKVAPNNNRNHPSEKPVELLERMILNSSEIGGTVLDSFMGSGSTGVACINTNRNFIGYELDDHYFKIAERRLLEAKGEM